MLATNISQAVSQQQHLHPPLKQVQSDISHQWIESVKSGEVKVKVGFLCPGADPDVPEWEHASVHSRTLSDPAADGGEEASGGVARNSNFADFSQGRLKVHQVSNSQPHTPGMLPFETVDLWAMSSVVSQ